MISIQSRGQLNSARATKNKPLFPLRPDMKFPRSIQGYLQSRLFLITIFSLSRTNQAKIRLFV